MSYSLNSLKAGFSRRLYRGLFSGLLRKIIGFSTMAHIAPFQTAVGYRGPLFRFHETLGSARPKFQNDTKP